MFGRVGSTGAKKGPGQFSDLLADVRAPDVRDPHRVFVHRIKQAFGRHKIPWGVDLRTIPSRKSQIPGFSNAQPARAAARQY